MPAASSLPRLRRFELLEVLGQGNSGVIYRARARVAMGGLQPGAEVALKILHPQLLDHEAARKAFLREARVGMKVRHPNLVKIYAVEEVQKASGRLLYLVLELLHGRTLREWLQAEGLAGEPTLRSLARQTASALTALHAAGLLHLDVKPENVLWDQDRAVLLDLGFVRRAPQPGADDRESGFRGTPVYAAPEVLRGHQPTPAADLFALGVTLYECATGVRPFGDERRRGLFAARSSAVVRKPSTIQPRLSRFFDALVLQLLAEDPAQRFASAELLEQVLREGEASAWWRDRARTAPLRPIFHPEALPFSGRAQELEILEGDFAAARAAGTVRLICLTGPSGIGKSRLAMEFAARWRERPEAPPFLYGRCPPIQHGAALLALRDALARSLGLVPGQTPSASIELRLHAALSRDAALTLLDVLRDQPRTRAERRAALREWLQALGNDGPFLVLLDDLHFAGVEMWTFLQEVMSLEGIPALILAAHQPELAADAAAARAALLELPGTRELALAPLAEQEIDQLLSRVFREGALPAELAAALAEGAQGSPGVLTELLRYLKQRGDLRGQAGSFHPTRRRIVVPPSPTQEQILIAAIGELPAEEREVLRWASLSSALLRPALLARATGFPEQQVARILGRLKRAGWLQAVQGEYRFELPASREAVYRDLPLEERQRRHGVALELLVEAELPEEELQAQLAFHSHRAGRHLEALRQGLPLVEKSLLQSAYARAEETLDLLQEHVEALDETRLDADLRVRWLLARAQALGVRQEHEQEAALLRQAGLLATAAGSDELRGRVHVGLARHARSMGFAGAARVHLEKARALRRRTSSGSAGGAVAERS